MSANGQHGTAIPWSKFTSEIATAAMPPRDDGFWISPGFSFLRVLRVLRGSIVYFKAAKMRSRIDSIEPTPGTRTYFGAPGFPLFAQSE
jgi:hypothetical protein